MKLTALTLICTLFLMGARAQSLSPVSLEQLVNTDIPTTQYNSQVAADPTGGYVIIWTTQESGGAVMGRRYDNTHTAISGELTINAETSNNISIEHWKAGKYIVSYLEGFNLKFAVLDAANVMGAEVSVISSTSRYDLSPKGDSLAFIYNRTSNDQLYLRGYNLASNSWLNAEMLVTEVGSADYDEPNIVYHTNGRMTAIYHMYINTSGCCTYDKRVMRKTFSSSYVAEIPEYALWSIDYQFNVGYDLDASGNNNNEVIVTTTHGTTSSQRYMRMWILGNTGTPIVNNAVMLPVVTTNDWYDYIKGYLYDNGDFVIAKTIRTGGYTNPNGSEAYVIYGTNYNASNSGLLRMNSTLSGDQVHTNVAKLPNGGFVGCWSGNGFQGDTQGIYSRAYNAVAFPGVVFSNAGAYTVSEAGTTATIGVTLATQPTANVTVNLSSSDLTEGTVSPAQLTFTTSNWNQAQNITVTGVDDTADDGNISFNLVASTTGSTDATYSGLANKTQAIITLDNDATITMPAAQSFCKSTGMSGVNAIFTNVGSAITSVTGASSDQSVVDNSDITVNNLGSGTYGITINNLNNNVTGTAQITLTATDGQFNYTGSFSITTTGVNLVVNASSNAICAGESVTLSATGGQNISWSNGVVNNVAFTPAATTTYTVTADNGSGCNATATQTITVTPVPAVPSISASGSLAICGNGAVTLTSSNATGNMWSTGANTQSITVSSTGTYTVSVSNGACSATSAPVAVTVNPAPAAPVITPNGPTTFCDGGSVTLTSSQANGNTWSTGAASQSITATTANTYVLTYTDANGCTSPAASILITVNPVPAAPVVSTSGPTAFCAGGSVTLTSSYASGNTWSNGSTASSITVSNGGTYSVTYSNGGACSATSIPVVVTANPVPAAPVITPNGPTTFCDGGSVTLTSSQASGNTWSTGVSSQSITAVTTNTYALTYTDANGCVSPSTSVLVTVQSAPNVSAGSDQTVCEGEMVTLLGSGATSYSWTGGITNGISFPITNQTTFQVTGTGSNGCTATDLVTVFVNSAPNVSAGPNLVVCNGESITLNGSGAATYDWDNGAVNGVSFVPTLGTTTYTVTGTNAAGCEAEDEMTVTVNQLPNVSISTIPVFCLSDGPAALTQGTPSGGTYTGTGITGVIFTPSTAGLGIFPVSYTYTDINGCENTAPGTITVDQCLGIDEQALAELSVYPNPTTGLAVIEFPGVFSYTVTDAQGRKVLEGNASDKAPVDLSAFSDGVYQVVIQTENASTSLRMVKNQ
ncbi:T9SS type A sorting domain-containing protein [Fluviicola sp.]|uniref:T9SS type A sorting domain-containing protein n=1 Tax=Fluviicola sp. TaxID=1917219 RepID=UPI0031DCB54E